MNKFLHNGAIAKDVEWTICDLELLYVQYSKFVRSIAKQYLQDQMEAEDVCHDVFLEVWRKADQFNPERGSIETWLAIITKSRCLDRLRKNRRLQLESWDDDLWWDQREGYVEEKVMTRLEWERVQKAVHRIPSHQRKALLGAYLDHYTHKELSKRMNRPLGTVKSLIRSGIHNLRKEIN